MLALSMVRNSFLRVMHLPITYPQVRLQPPPRRRTRVARDRREDAIAIPVAGIASMKPYSAVWLTLAAKCSRPEPSSGAGALEVTAIHMPKPATVTGTVLEDAGKLVIAAGRRRMIVEGDLNETVRRSLGLEITVAGYAYPGDKLNVRSVFVTAQRSGWAYPGIYVPRGARLEVLREVGSLSLLRARTRSGRTVVLIASTRNFKATAIASTGITGALRGR